MSERSDLKIFSFKYDSDGDLFYCVCFKKDFDRYGAQVVNDFGSIKGVENNIPEAAESFLFSLQCSNRHKEYILARKTLSENIVLSADTDCGVVRFPNQIAS